MEFNKLNNIIKKYNLSNIIKVILLLIVLFLIYRIFIESPNTSIYKNHYLNENIYEGFQASLGNTIYGNVISLNNPKNIPSYFNNTCIFKLSDTFRIDSLEFILNNNNPANPIPENSSFYNTNQNITISFVDGNGNIKNINGISSTSLSLSSDSPPTFTPDSNNLIKLTLITDENSLPVYTSQIILNVNGNNNMIDKIIDNNGFGYVKGFGIYGGDRNLPTINTYTNISNTLNSDTSFQLKTSSSTISSIANINSYNFIQGTDTMIYSFALTISRNNIQNKETDAPYNIKITYQNTIYPTNIFTINTKYIIRSDKNLVMDDNTYSYIFLTEPIIANNITFTVSKPPITNSPTELVSLNIINIKVLNNNPNANDILNYKQSVNLIQSNQDENTNTNICPSINELVDTQTKTQKICDNMEYQDKLKSEKLRLERNKQYLLKLKTQQEQIDQLNTAIQSLEDKRKSRAEVSDQVRILQYQKQKADASTIRDLANQRLESQDNNKLYMDVNINNT